MMVMDPVHRRTQDYSYIERHHETLNKTTIYRTRFGRSPHRAVVYIPYCGKSLEWEIVYCPHNPLLAPDFVLQEGDEFIISYSQVQSIKNYSPDNADALVNIVVEMLDIYMKYHEQLVGECTDQRIQFEKSTISSDVQYYVDRIDNMISFFIPLDICMTTELGQSDSIFSISGRRKGEKTRPSQLAVLFTFRVGVSSTSNIPECRLMLPPQWQASFSKIGKLPTFSKDSCLMEHVPLIAEEVRKYLKVLKLRKKLLCSIIEQLGLSPLEYDSVLFSRVMFAGSDTGFPVMISVTNIDNYPDKSPLVAVHPITGVGKTRLLDAFGTNSRLTESDVAAKVVKQINDIDYKKFSETN